MLKLPIPAKSTQLLGKEFVGDEGRGANLINIGNGTVVVSRSHLLWLQCPRQEPVQDALPAATVCNNEECRDSYMC